MVRHFRSGDVGPKLSNWSTGLPARREVRLGPGPGRFQALETARRSPGPIFRPTARADSRAHPRNSP